MTRCLGGERECRTSSFLVLMWSLETLENPALVSVLVLLHELPSIPPSARTRSCLSLGSHMGYQLLGNPPFFLS